MKKIIFMAFLGSTIGFSSCDTLTRVANQAAQAAQAGTLGVADIANGLKEALTNGVVNGSNKLSSVDGFLGDAAVKILLPPEARDVADKLRAIGAGSLVNVAEEKLNRAAELAAKSAATIFLNSLQQMTFNDAKNILMGSNNAATDFFVRTTKSQLYASFMPTIQSSLNQVGAVKAWNDVFSRYNSIPFVSKINPNLDDYVTNKAIDGVFTMVAREEANIRANPSARLTPLLQRVFAQQDKK